MTLQSSKLSQLRERLGRRVTYLLWEQPLESASLPRRFLVRTVQIIYAIGNDWRQGQLSLHAMSLVYSTVLGFIPMVALIFAVLKSLGVHNAMEPTLLTLLEALGDRREEITAQIIQFVDNIQVEVIGITSLGLLVYLVLDMMRKIESSFNYIWSVSRGRSWSSRVSEYLFAVIVSPLLIFISISITSSVNTHIFARLLEDLAFGSSLLAAMAFLLPLLFMSLAFAFAYSFLPNTRVQFSSAFIGGLVTTIIWKLMGAFFQGFFITAARESIYLAFATVIAVMIFTYVGWLVALMGSDIAYYHQYPARCRLGRRQLVLSPRQKEQLALIVAAMIIRRFQNGEQPLNADQLALRLGVSTLAIDDTLAELQQVGLLVATSEIPSRYVPATGTGHNRIADVWARIRNHGVVSLGIPDGLAEAKLIETFLSRVDEAVGRELGAASFTTKDEDP